MARGKNYNKYIISKLDYKEQSILNAREHEKLRSIYLNKFPETWRKSEEYGSEAIEGNW